MVPYDRPHVMEGVVGILMTARQLLDVGEHRNVGNTCLLYLRTGLVKVPPDLAYPGRTSSRTFSIFV